MPWRQHDNNADMNNLEGVPQQRGLAGLGLHMGQGSSSPSAGETTGPASPSTAANLASKTFAIGSAAASSTGKNFKRALNVRKKKPSLAPDEIMALADPGASSKKSLNIFGKRAAKSESNSPTKLEETSYPVPGAYDPPPLPPAPVPPPQQPAPSPPASSSNHTFPNRGSSLQPPIPVLPQPENPPSTSAAQPQRTSIIPMTPNIAHAVRYMQQGQSPDSPSFGLTSTKEEEPEEKENWRKSDSTMSHHTIRPGPVGSRTPRPGSVVATLPEDDDQSSVETSSSYSLSNQSRPSLGDRHYSSDISQEFGGRPNYPHPQQWETPSLSKAAANGVIGPSSTGSQSTGNNIRGRLAAWTGTSKNASSDALPHHKGSLSIASQTSLASSHGTPRSTSNGFGAGFAKRAVEKMGRALGGMTNGSSGSLSDSTPPSSFHGPGADSDSSSSGDRKHGRTPNAPSGSWSIASSTNTGASSDSDIPVGPYLGNMLRPPVQPEGGALFGKPLRLVVQRTPPVPVPFQPREVELIPGLNEKIAAIGQRRLPAVAVRCAQHVLLWGLEEEGLFRVNGRPSHVNKLRGEFDTGADYDMSRCSPGELDPHAVAGVFKAFLRELPEPLLTHALVPYFDAAMQQETSRNESVSQSSPMKARGPGLPSGPRAGLQQMRKPPSLSTLAMPNFQNMRAASPELVKALRSLIAQLPIEHRDLLMTVVDLIKATARQSRVTKMPLSNLLLVFCPSLHMSPPLLRTLSESDLLWEDSPSSRASAESLETPTVPASKVMAPEQNVPSQTMPPPQASFDINDVLDIRRQTLVVDIKAATEPQEPQTNVDETPSTSKPFVNDGTPKASGASRRRSSNDEDPASPVSPSLMVGRGANIPRPLGPRKASSSNLSRPGTATSGASNIPFREPSSSSSPTTSQPPSDMEILEALKDASSPPSSSAESLLTPSSSDVPSVRQSLDETSTKPAVPGTPAISVMSDGPTPLDLSNPRRPAISGPIGPPVHFPTMALPTTPHTPQSATNGKRSVSGSSIPPSPSSARMKKPSLTLLFKRSNPSLRSESPRPVISNPIPLSAESTDSIPFPGATPLNSAPPVLDANLDGFGLGLDLDFTSKSPKANGHAQPAQPVQPEPVIASAIVAAPVPSRTPDLPMRSTTPTPIADLYSSASSSSASLSSSSSNELQAPAPSLPPVTHLRLKPGRSGHAAPEPAIADLPSRFPIEEDDDYEDDWTKTVLLAADVDWRSIPTNTS